MKEKIIKINTNNINTVPLLRRTDVAYENRGSEWHYHWLSWLILCISLNLGLGLTSDAQAGSRKGYCGGNGQRPCNVWEVFPSCDSGLAQNFDNNTCGADVVAEFVEESVNDAAGDIISVGETVVKFSTEQGKKAVDEAKKGVAEAGKAIEGVAVEAYIAGAETFLVQIKTPLENMAKA